jgi:hypothetical protein|tara:strand:+ start:2334 stop:2606 length:273 start_codon:yes stop_codon:yes gene_type:complete
MKTRRKNNIEMSHDIKLLDEARRDLAEEAVNFLHEFNQTEGRCIPYFSVMDFQDKVWQYEREKENSAMPKVGDTWDWENKVCGEYRYRDI